MGILERITRNVDNRYWYPERNTFPVKNRYTAGLAGQRFFQEIKANAKIYGTRCPACDVTFVPARQFCEMCFAELDTWIDVGTEGTVFSFTVARKNRDRSEKEKPTLLAAIKIADGLLVHWLGECEPEDVEIGMPVIAKFKKKADRRGSILDILYFCPSR